MTGGTFSSSSHHVQGSGSLATTLGSIALRLASRPARTRNCQPEWRRSSRGILVSYPGRIHDIRPHYHILSWLVMFIRLRVGGRCQWDTYYTSRPGTTRPLRALARLSHGLGRRLGPDSESISPALAALLVTSGRQAAGLQVKPRAGTMIPLLAGHVSGANMRRASERQASWHESGWAASRSRV